MLLLKYVNGNYLSNEKDFFKCLYLKILLSVIINNKDRSCRLGGRKGGRKGPLMVSSCKAQDTKSSWVLVGTS